MSRRFCFAVTGVVCCVLVCSCNRSATPTNATGEAKVNDAEHAAAMNPAEDNDVGQSAETILRQVADFYSKADALQVGLTQTTSVRFQGMENESTTEFTLIAQRPNRLSIRDKNGESVDFVSDGENLYTVVHPMKTYTVAKAPATFASLAQDPMQFNMLGMGNLIAIGLLSQDPYAEIMEGVNSLTYVEREADGDDAAHRLKFQKDQFDWEMWVAAEDDPVVLKLVFDMSKQMALAGQSDAKMSATVLYQNWSLNPTLDNQTFAFKPAADIKKVDSFFEGLTDSMRGQEEVSPLVGKPAPEITSTMLDGSPFKLQDRNAESILLVDFWATWCGPCVMELPILMKVAEQYSDRGVRLFAINQGEDKETIQQFLNQKKWDLNVVLDQEGAASTAYAVEGIPQLVIIDKQGKIQSVHVGYSPDIENVLQRELDALLEGKDLAAEAVAEREAMRAAAPKPFGLAPAWEKQNGAQGLAVDQRQKTIYALTSGRMEAFNAKGEAGASVVIDGQFQRLRLAELDGQAGAEFVAFNPWGRDVVAISSDGTDLWTESGGQGIDDVWARDLDGDGQDEVIVGYNGGTGLHVFGHDGVRRWKYDKIGNVWHVAAADVTGDSNIEVVTTSAAGRVHVFSNAGEEVQNLDAGVYANMVRIATTAMDASKPLILVIGGGLTDASMVALSGDGQEQWKVDFPAGSRHADSLMPSPDGRWAAAGMRGGTVYVVDLEHGTIVAQAVEQGAAPQVDWLGGGDDGEPLLLVATGQSLNAFHVQPASAKSTEDDMADALPDDGPIPKKNETVMAPGSRLTATTPVGKIAIDAGQGLRRSYTWDGATRSVEMWPRQERWYGSLGLYYPGPGNHWPEHNGITRGVVEEGQQHFDTVAEAMSWIEEQQWQPLVWTNSGLVVGWGKTPVRKQLNVDVWQVYVDGKKPTTLPGADDTAIVVENSQANND